MTFVGMYELVGQVVGSAHVWKAFDPGLNRYVALKTINAASPRAVQALIAEAKVLADLQHPNVVAVYGTVVIEDQPWLVEEWIDGSPLPATIAQVGKLPSPTAVGVIRGALRGLAYVHVRGIVHGDISPNNILIELDGTSKLIDFGLAAPIGSTSFAGTAGYVSPEVAQGLPATPADDVFSAAAVMYLLLQGRPLFAGQTEAEVLAVQLATTRPPDLTGVGKHLSGVLTTALAPAHEDRYPDAGAFLDALEHAAERDYGIDWLLNATVAGIGAAAITLKLASDTSMSVVRTSEGIGEVQPTQHSLPLQSRSPLGTPTSPPSPTEISATPPPPTASNRGSASASTRDRDATGSARWPRKATALAAAVAGLLSAAILFAVAHRSTTQRSTTRADAVAATPSATHSEVNASHAPGHHSNPTEPTPAAVLSWSAPTRIDPHTTGAFDAGAVSISCPTTTFCVAADDEGYAATFDGSVWNTPIHVSHRLSAVSCATATFCIGVGADNYVRFDGSTWTSPAFTGPDSSHAGTFTAVSCPQTNFCAAATATRDVFTFDGASWADTNAAAGQLVSCASPTFCVADTAAGNTQSIFNGSTWSSPNPYGSGQTPGTPSCASVSFCAIVSGGIQAIGPGVAGWATTFQAGQWDTSVTISTAGYLNSVSCPTDIFCIATDTTGHAYTYTTTTWNEGQDIDPGGHLNAVSCATSFFCMAVDSQGNAIEGDTSQPVNISRNNHT